MNSLYSAAESLEIDLGINEIDDLMELNKKLTEENEAVTKKIREIEHDLKQKIVELEMKNENIKRSYTNLEGLLITYQSNSTVTSTNNNSKEIEELEHKVTDLENKIFIREQSELSLKRANQELNIEISNLRIEVNKLMINGTPHKKEYFTMKSTDGDNIDDTTKLLLTELMNEIDELKTQKNDISENALNILTQKELEVMELREEIDQIKESYKQEINTLHQVMNNLKGELEENTWNKECEDLNDNVSLNSEEQRELVNQYNQIKEEYDDLVKKNLHKENEYNQEKEKHKKEIEIIEINYKNNLNDLESEMLRLKQEVNIKSFEKMELEREISQDSKNNDQLIQVIEDYEAQIRQIESIKEANESNHKGKIKLLENDLKDLEEINNSLKVKIQDLETELKTLRVNDKKYLKELQEKLKYELSFKERENSLLRDKIESLAKEKEQLTKEEDNLKKNYNKLKHEYIEFTQSIKQLRENQELEIKKLQEKLYSIEIKEHIDTNKEMRATKISLLLDHKDKFVSQMSLSDALNNDNDEGKILELEDEITCLNNRIAELIAKLKMNEKVYQECEELRKENNKLKLDMKELKHLFEQQIKVLEDKSIKVNAEFTSNRKMTATLRKSIATFSTSELEIALARLGAENKFLNEKIEISNKEIENKQKLRESDVAFLKNELEKTEEIAITAKVKLANISLMKDSELVKYKNAYKKLKTRMLEMNEVALKRTETTLEKKKTGLFSGLFSNK